MTMRIQSMKHARDITRCCFCLRCGKRRIPTGSGAVCEEHRLQLGVPHEWFELIEEAIGILDLPKVQVVEGQNTRCRFTIDGLTGEYVASQSGQVRAVDIVPRPRIRTYKRLKHARN